MAHTIGPHLTEFHNAGKDEIGRIAASTPRGAAGARHWDRQNHVEIPDPRLFQGLETPSVQKDCTVPIPSISECAVHLELLELFYYLHVRVLQSTELDAAFGIFPQKKTVYRKNYTRRKYEPVTLKDETFENRRKVKWGYFLDLAALRFMRWAQKVNETTARALRGLGDGAVRISLLPPLDILMVWHSLLLNPMQFENYCKDNKLTAIAKLPFPWLEIHKAIDSEKWVYKQPEHEFNDSSSELDLFEHLVQVGEARDRARTASSWTSRQQSQPTTSENGLPGARSKYISTLRGELGARPECRTLRGNVERQTSFINKMHEHLWIRSPAVEGTLRRAVDRYEKFLQLFKLYPGTTLVPTLDIDLVWHTHQCSPEHYRHSMVERAGKFINHDDTIGTQTLSHGMDETAGYFLVRFGQEYNPCNCWDCEAVASAIEESANGDEDGEQLLEAAVENTVRRVALRVAYYRKVELERRLGGALPF